MKIIIGGPTGTDYSEWYSRDTGGVSISDSFDKTARSATANFSLVDPDTVPKVHQMVLLYDRDDAPSPIFSGTIKSISKTIVAAHEIKSNAAVYQITAESWELGCANLELITYQAYYSRPLSYILADIVDRYMPHIDDSEIALDDDPIFSQIIFVNRRPNEAISAVCQKVGLHWWIDWERKLHVAQLGDGSCLSPLTVANASRQLEVIDLDTAVDAEDTINDLYLRSGAIQYYPVQDIFQPNGFDGDYPLTHKPFGLETVIPIIDEFAGGDTPAAVDSSVWYELGDGDQFRTQIGRLQIANSGIGAGAVVSRGVVSTSGIFRARDLEVEFTAIDSGHYFIMGLYPGVEDPTDPPDPALFLLGLKVEDDGTLVVIVNGVETSTGIKVLIGTGKAYQFKLLLLPGGQYTVYIQGDTFGLLGSKDFFELDGGTLDVSSHAYTAFCPAYSSGGVAGTVIQGAVLVDPNLSGWLQEIAYLTSIREELGAIYLSNQFANWSKWNLEGLPIYLYGSDGTEYQTYGGSPIVISTNDTQQLNLSPGIPLSWFTTNDIVSYKMDWRRMIISVQASNDYETHGYIEVIEDTPVLRLYGGELPTGVIQLDYYAEAAKTIRMQDPDSIADILANSGVPNDTGIRAGFEEADTTIRTYDDLIMLAKTILTSQDSNFVQGSFQTDTYKLNEFYPGSSYPGDQQLISGMDQAVNIVVGGETITATSYISSVSLEDIGGGVMSISVSLGNYKEYIHSLFLAKLAKLYKTGLSIDDAASNEQMMVTAMDLADADTKVGTPTVTQAWFDDTGVYIEWQSSSVGGSGSYTPYKTELRLDDKPGSNGSTCLLYQQSYTAGVKSYTIATASVTLRKYTFYIYDIDAAGNYSRIPRVVSLENRQPVPTPFLDIRVTDNQTCKIVLCRPLEPDVRTRVIYVNNEYTADDKLADSDLIFSLSPYHTEVEFTLYATRIYVTLVDRDVYYALDDKPNRFNRTMDADYIAAPPHEPTALSVFTAYDDPAIAPNSVRLNVNIPTETNYGDPEWLHIEFCDTLGSGSSYDPFPDIIPVVEGSSDGVLETANAEYILVPKSYDLSAVEVGQLMVIRHPCGHGYQGRFIETITLNYDANYHKVDTTDSFILDQDTDYDWEVWPLWYEDPVIESYLDIPINDSNVTFTGGVYQVTISRSPFNGYVRVFPGNRHGLADSAICGSTFTVYSGLDTGVPSPVRNIVGYAEGMNVIVLWDEPLLNATSLKYYTVYLSVYEYVALGGDEYELTQEWSTTVAAGLHTATVPVSQKTRYAVGVSATNGVGESEVAIFGLDP